MAFTVNPSAFIALAVRVDKCAFPVPTREAQKIAIAKMGGRKGMREKRVEGN
jgi:hypothetical protein